MRYAYVTGRDVLHAEGMTVVDQLGNTGKKPNLDVCWAIDVALWKETLYKTLV